MIRCFILAFYFLFRIFKVELFCIKSTNLEMAGLSAQNCKYTYSRIHRRMIEFPSGTRRRIWTVNCRQDKSTPGPSAELCGNTNTVKHVAFKEEPQSDSSDCETNDSSKRAIEKNEKTSLGKNAAFKKETGSDSSDSETDYVLQMVMDENKIFDKMKNGIKKEISSLEHTALPELSLQCLHEDKTVSDQHDLNLNASSSLPPVSSSSRNNLPNAHKFEIKIFLYKREKDYLCYSAILKKLFVSKDISIPISVYAEKVPCGSVLRATPMFRFLKSNSETVQRCPNHAVEDKLKGSSLYDHVIQSTCLQASYEKHPITGQCSVIVPYKEPIRFESRYSTYNYKFTCFSSCTNGISRRPIYVLFTLEKDGVILGVQNLDVKVCACPFRDMQIELDKVTDLPPSSSQWLLEGEGGRNEEKKAFSITVDDPDLFLFLNQMKNLYEICDDVKSLTEQMNASKDTESH